MIFWNFRLLLNQKSHYFEIEGLFPQIRINEPRLLSYSFIRKIFKTLDDVKTSERSVEKIKTSYLVKTTKFVDDTCIAQFSIFYMSIFVLSSLLISGEECQFFPFHCQYRQGARNLYVVHVLSLIHIWRCRRSTLCRSRWSPYH